MCEGVMSVMLLHAMCWTVYSMIAVAIGGTIANFEGGSVFKVAIIYYIA